MQPQAWQAVDPYVPLSYNNKEPQMGTNGAKWVRYRRMAVVGDTQWAGLSAARL